ncbi:MAG: YcxB family protein [Chitinophagaceae bacterium]|nr:YcxB family protein [Chitinophagaceae bacterium]
MLSFRFRLTEEEFLQFNYYTAWGAPERKKYRIYYFLRVMLLYGAVAMLYIVATRQHYIWIDISVFVITGTLYLIMIPSFVKSSIRRKVKDILSKKENQHVLGEAEVILSNSGIVDKDTYSESRYNWDAIMRQVETDDSFYLYTNSYHAIVIPKRIATADQQNELRRMLSEHLPLDA